MRQRPGSTPSSSPSRWAEAPPAPAAATRAASTSASGPSQRLREGSDEGSDEAPKALKDGSEGSEGSEGPSRASSGVCVSFPVTGARDVHDEALGSYAFPTAIEPCSSDVAGDLSATLRWAESNASELEHALTTSGALLLRGFPCKIRSTSTRSPPRWGTPNSCTTAPAETRTRARAQQRTACCSTARMRARRARRRPCWTRTGSRSSLTFAPAFVDELEGEGRADRRA